MWCLDLLHIAMFICKQIYAYISALQPDLVIFSPTGYGTPAHSDLILVDMREYV